MPISMPVRTFLRLLGPQEKGNLVLLLNLDWSGVGGILQTNIKNICNINHCFTYCTYYYVNGRKLAQHNLKIFLAAHE